nr:hypothetical protein [Paenibacillus xylanexedens]
MAALREFDAVALRVVTIFQLARLHQTVTGIVFIRGSGAAIRGIQQVTIRIHLYGIVPSPL